MSILYLLDKVERKPVAAPATDIIDNPYYQEYLTLTQKQWMFSDLLPMDKEQTILITRAQKYKVLNQIKNLFKYANEAISEFYLERNMHKFDPHVGEASCQLRSIHLLVLNRQVDIKCATSQIDLIKKINKKIIIINNLLNKYLMYSKRLDGKLSLKDYLKKYDLDFELNKSICFIITSFILTRYKKYISLEKEIIDYKKHVAEWGVSKTASKKMMAKLQRINALFTVDYVLKTNANNEVKYLLQKDDNERFVLPSFEISKFSIRLIQKLNIPIILDIWHLNKYNKEEHFCFIKFENNHFELYKQNNNLKTSFQKKWLIINMQCFTTITKFLNNETDFINILKTFNLFDIALASLASHSQYPGHRLKEYSQYPYDLLSCHCPSEIINHKTSELRNYQALALQNGLCNMNPEKLVIAHIRPERLDKIGLK